MTDKSKERQDLEARAEAVELEFPWNLGDAKLRERVEAAEAERQTADQPPADGTGAELAPAGAPEASTETAPTSVPDTEAPKEPQPAEVTPPTPSDAPPTSEDGDPQSGGSPLPPSGLVVRVIGPKKGRWRAGRHFTREAVDIPLEELSEDEKRMLIGDPKLTVETVEAEAD
ncbi:hypothetical protein [Pseudoruegeria sp. HB172150]|uniref:hypothetical protein n=1 Tax=Pseudoruegeria sp. HB172150 TaxID=2721164 RepID=UPI001554FA9C|nr:hypothetical protein [Pseudoruegeria sp. HB172150]